MSKISVRTGVSRAFSAFVLVAFVGQMGCATSRAHLEPQDFKGPVQIQNASFAGESLGPVRGEDGGAVWDDCSIKAKGSLREIMYNAKVRGANAVGDLRWTATGSSAPGCKKSWGYVIILPFILTPLFMSTEVTGVAYRAKGVAANRISIPDTESELDALIDALVAAK